MKTTTLAIPILPVLKVSQNWRRKEKHDIYLKQKCSEYNSKEKNVKANNNETRGHITSYKFLFQSKLSESLADNYCLFQVANFFSQRKHKDA